MRAVALADGRLRVPVTVLGPGGMPGDGVVVIDSSHPDFEEWRKAIAGEGESLAEDDR